MLQDTICSYRLCLQFPAQAGNQGIHCQSALGSIAGFADLGPTAVVGSVDLGPIAVVGSADLGPIAVAGSAD